MPEKIIPIECSHCHEPFLGSVAKAYKVKIGKLRFCSKECRIASKYRKVPVLERLLGRLNKNGPIPEHRPELGPCWVWIGPLNENGYANLRDDDWRTVKAHRISFREHKGEIPEGYEIDHLCRNRACSNPDHLEAVTHMENVQRSTIRQYHASITHCPRGHEYTKENTKLDKRGPYLLRGCLACKRQRYHDKKKQQICVVDSGSVQ